MSSRPSYNDTDEWIEYDETLRASAERHGIEISEADRADGLWEGESEPAGAPTSSTAQSFEQITAWAGEIAGRYSQDSVMAGYFDQDGPHRVYSFPVSLDEQDRVQHTLDILRDAGASGGRLYDGKLEIAEPAASPLPPAAVNAIASRLGVDPSFAQAHVTFVEGMSAICGTRRSRRSSPSASGMPMLRDSLVDAASLT